MQTQAAVVVCVLATLAIFSQSTPTESDPQTNFNIVYTWVNGSDPELLADIKQYTNKISAARVRDREELRFSLRSVEKYMPWFQGNIIIFTNHRPPDWLDLNHPRIRVVPHKQIIPDTYLPTFNSDGIEFFLSLLPEVGERFLYLNDDMFIGDWIDPGDIFNKTGHPVLRFTPTNKVYGGLDKHDVFRNKGSNKWLANIYWTHHLLNEKYGEKSEPYGFLHHTPYPMLKTVLDRIKTDWPDHSFHAVTQRSRDYRSIQTPSMHHWLCQTLGLGEPYFKSNPRNEYKFITATKVPEMRKSLEVIEKDHYTFFNIADYPDDPGMLDTVLNWMNKNYPHPSSFEKM